MKEEQYPGTNTHQRRLNAQRLALEMQWLAEVIDTRMNGYWKRESKYADIREVPIPTPADDASMLGSVLQHYQMDLSERVILLLALAPHVMPHLLDVFFVKNADYDRGFTEFGGVRGQSHAGFIPTGETAAFILAVDDLDERFKLFDILGDEHFFKKHNILKLVHGQAEEPFLSGTIAISNEYLAYFTTGLSYRPTFSINFPAKRISTSLDWSDLVLDAHTLNLVEEIKDWIEYGDTLIDDLAQNGKIKPGYRSLFFGPPGTGKTLTACLLGKSTGLDVYRVDLSMVVSKYIGETEKNLANVFEQAEQKGWILFFDEADALFGKRTQTSSSNDRYANQEVSYLLQRVEDFNGVVILATNLKTNLDEAFTRRFQSMIHFPMPDAEQRLRLWQGVFPGKATLDEKLNLGELAEKFVMAGGAMVNVSRYSSLMALKRGTTQISKQDVMTGIRREFGKDGKIV